MCDSKSILNPDRTCSKCPIGSFKSGKETCQVCTPACISCLDENNCFECIAGFTLNPNTLRCDFEYVCGPNEIDQNGVCVCDTGFNRISGVCDVCPINTIYNPTFEACQAEVVCRADEIKLEDQCVCNERSIRVDGLCTLCPDG